MVFSCLHSKQVQSSRQGPICDQKKLCSFLQLALALPSSLLCFQEKSSLVETVTAPARLALLMAGSLPLDGTAKSPTALQ